MASDESQTRSYFVTFSATASTTGTTDLELPEGYLTELSARVEGTITTTDISGGPVRIELWLRRGQSYRKLCSGGIQAEYSVKGSGKLRVKKNDAIVIKWTEVSGSAVLVRVDAFMDEHGLGTGAPGWHDETMPGVWLYQARRVATQANVAGGAVKVDISTAAGQTVQLVGSYVANSGTNDLTMAVLDEDNATAFNGGTIASGASRAGSWPNIGTSTAHANVANSQCLDIGPGQKLSFYQTGAGAQNDTMTIAIALLSTVPVTLTWSKARSTNEADVTLAASSISATNTWQFVPRVTL